MRRVFITTSVFWNLWKETGLNDDDIRDLEDYLIENPDAGDVVRSACGLRKLRWKTRTKGKRGGIRVLYVDFPGKEKLFFISLIRKNETAGLTQGEKKIICKLIKEIEKSL
ncbi:MAG: type II toxin-antitoxin system RelE/ParE family toxin [Ignavibacteria bacterium]|nr:type II toxin-antitoxin system RelE/ParE family toxin [Ignavibacteria bacterium]